MISPSSFPRFARLLAGATLLLALPATAADPTRIVFQNGRAVDIAAVAIQGDSLVVKTSADGFNAGQTFPLASADHVYGDKPAALNNAVALLLSEKPSEALALLEPVLASQSVTARIPGNYWLEAARAALIAYAMNGNSSRCNDIGKEISDATPAQGNDPFVSLGKALLLGSATKLEDRELALRDLTTDNLPADVCAYASFYRARLLKSAKRDKEALEAYLSVPCLFPAGGMVLCAAAEVNAAEYLTAMDRGPEAKALFESAIRGAPGTTLASDANKRLESLK